MKIVNTREVDVLVFRCGGIVAESEGFQRSLQIVKNSR